MTDGRPDAPKPTPTPSEFSCNPTYPFHPCHSPTTLPTTRPPRDLAPTGLDFHGAFLFEGVLLSFALVATVVGRWKSARRERAANERIARRYR